MDNDRPDLSAHAAIPILCAGGAFVLWLTATGVAADAWISAALAALAARIALIDATRFIIPPFELRLLVLLGMLRIVLDTAPGLSWRLLAAGAHALAYGLVFELVRRAYLHVRHRNGMGFGDVKLAAACGLWLAPGDFSLAVFGAALSGIVAFVILQRRRPSRLPLLLKIPFGTMLAPWLWLIWFGTTVTGG